MTRLMRTEPLTLQQFSSHKRTSSRKLKQEYIELWSCYPPEGLRCYPTRRAGVDDFVVDRHFPHLTRQLTPYYLL